MLRAQVNSYSVIPFGTLTYLLGNIKPAPSHIPPTQLDRDTADLINKWTSVSDRKQTRTKTQTQTKFKTNHMFLRLKLKL